MNILSLLSNPGQITEAVAEAQAGLQRLVTVLDSIDHRLANIESRLAALQVDTLDIKEILDNTNEVEVKDYGGL